MRYLSCNVVYFLELGLSNEVTKSRQHCCSLGVVMVVVLHCARRVSVVLAISMLDDGVGKDVAFAIE